MTRNAFSAEPGLRLRVQSYVLAPRWPSHFKLTVAVPISTWASLMSLETVNALEPDLIF